MASLRDRPHLQGLLLLLALWGLLVATIPFVGASFDLGVHHRAEVPAIETVDVGVAREGIGGTEPAP
ncbi:MAG TPA: hypothetical protein VGQ20_12560 [Acidimicrobiales bacterium]|nr:hypothetical protein [Acidimicrobiales bacterium]